MITIPAYKGRDNKESLVVSDAEGEVDFAAAGYTSAKLLAGGASIDCALQTAGVVEFTPGDFDIPSGQHLAQLVLFGPTKPDGVVVLGVGQPVALQLSVYTSQPH